jgi:hypothetical protein
MSKRGESCSEETSYLAWHAFEPQFHKLSKDLVCFDAGLEISVDSCSYYNAQFSQSWLS